MTSTDNSDEPKSEFLTEEQDSSLHLKGNM